MRKESPVLLTADDDDDEDSVIVLQSLIQKLRAGSLR